MKITIRPIFKLGLAIALIVVLLSHLNVAFTFEKIRAVDLYAIGAAVLMILLAVVLAAMKFRLALTDFHFWPVLRTTVLLQFYNIYLPGQVGGEVLRIYMLGGNRSDTHQVIAATVLDKLTGLLSLCILMLCAFVIEPYRFGKPLTLAFALMTLAAFAGSLLLAYSDQRWLDAALLRLPIPSRAAQIAQPCLLSIQRFARRPKYLAQSLLIGIAHQALIVGAFMSIGTGLGIHVSAATWTIVVGVTSLVMVLPITFAGIGTRDISLVTMLGFAAVQPETALALAFAVMGVQTIIGTASGLLHFMPRPLELKFKQIRRARDTADPPTGPTLPRSMRSDCRNTPHDAASTG